MRNSQISLEMTRFFLCFNLSYHLCIMINNLIQSCMSTALQQDHSSRLGGRPAFRPASVCYPLNSVFILLRKDIYKADIIKSFM